jgi:hypothetical protein
VSELFFKFNKKKQKLKFNWLIFIDLDDVYVGILSYHIGNVTLVDIRQRFLNHPLTNLEKLNTSIVREYFVIYPVEDFTSYERVEKYLNSWVGLLKK